jgi:hypothetical protein
VFLYFSATHNMTQIHYTYIFLVNGMPVSEPAYLKLHRYCWPINDLYDINLLGYLILTVCDSPSGGLHTLPDQGEVVRYLQELLPN